MLLIIKIIIKFALTMTQEASDINKLPVESAPGHTPAQAATATAENQDGGKPWHKTCAWIGAFITLSAWIALIFNGEVSFFLALAGVIVSAFGVKSPRGLVRDMAITAVVASGVLLVVFAIFFGLLQYLDHIVG